MTNHLFIAQYVGRATKAIQGIDIYKLSEAMDAIRTAIQNGNVIFSCGNGGSAAIAAHFATDIVKCAAAANPDYQCRAICLNDSISTLTAAANDTGYENAFIPALKAFSQRGDILVAISGSGNSQNILRAVEFFKASGCGWVIGVTSALQGELRNVCDIPLLVQETHMGALEDQFQMLLHVIAYNLMEVPIG